MKSSLRPFEIEIRESLKGRHFLKGPIPWWWLERAMRLPGRATHVGLVVWLCSGMRRAATIRLSITPMFSALGISRYAAYRGLNALERAQLVHVRRHGGHPPIVTLVLDQQVKAHGRPSQVRSTARRAAAAVSRV